MVHQEYGRKLLDRMTEELSDLAIIERSPLVEGRNMIMILSPTAKKHPRADRPHDDRVHAEAHAAAGNGSASTGDGAVAVAVPSAKTPAAVPEAPSAAGTVAHATSKTGDPEGDGNAQDSNP